MTKIYLDSGDPQDTKRAIKILAGLDLELEGQTTNPSLVAKSPEVLARIESGDKFDLSELMDLYRSIALEIDELLPGKSISLEMDANSCTERNCTVEQGEDLATWVSNAYIKLPITDFGLEAASHLVAEGYNVNMTLNFSQEQAAAVHAATNVEGVKPGQVYISPFIGRLDDTGVDGMSVVRNISKMYKEAGSHVQVLAASIRSASVVQDVIDSDIDLITVPMKALVKMSDKAEALEKDELKTVEYQELDMTKDWTEYNIQHDLTDAGLLQFNSDWAKLLK